MQPRDVPDTFILEQLDEDLEFYSLAQIDSDPRWVIHADVGRLATRALELLGRYVLKGEAGSAAAHLALQQAAMLRFSQFALAALPAVGDGVEVRIPGVATALWQTRSEDSSTTHALRWLETMHLLLCIWDTPRLAQMVEWGEYVPQASSTRMPAYVYAHVTAMQAMVGAALRSDPPRVEDDVVQKVMACLEATHQAAPEDAAHAQFQTAQEVGLLGAVALHDAARVESEIELTVQAHLRYYLEFTGETARNAPEAWLCLPALGVYNLARQRGLNVQVNSPFVPLQLLG